MQFGVHAGLSSRRSRVQIPSGPPSRSTEMICRPVRPRATGRQGRVAQLVERAPEKREVTGSTPVPTTEKVQVSGGADLTGAGVGDRRALHVPQPLRHALWRARAVSGHARTPRIWWRKRGARSVAKVLSLGTRPKGSRRTTAN